GHARGSQGTKGTASAGAVYSSALSMPLPRCGWRCPERAPASGRHRACTARAPLERLCRMRRAVTHRAEGAMTGVSRPRRPRRWSGMMRGVFDEGGRGVHASGGGHEEAGGERLSSCPRGRRGVGEQPIEVEEGLAEQCERETDTEAEIAEEVG